MENKCSYCGGVKAFCITNKDTNVLLFFMEDYDLNENTTYICPRFNRNGDISNKCITHRFLCKGICPVCKGTGKDNWINEFFIDKTENHPTKEDFKRLRQHYIKYWSYYNLNFNFIRSILYEE